MTVTDTCELRLPFFVVITIAPSFARAPYNAVAAAPFNTLIDSMSSELISPARFPTSIIPLVLSGLYEPLSIGKPSTMNSGEETLPIEEAPRICMLELPPAVPDDCPICTPAILPDNEFKTLLSRALVISSPLTLVTEYPKDFSERLIPIAVTTISSRFWESDFRTTFN